MRLSLPPPTKPHARGGPGPYASWPLPPLSPHHRNIVYTFGYYYPPPKLAWKRKEKEDETLGGGDAKGHPQPLNYYYVLVNIWLEYN